jgi:GT2 family glycosyltransferase
MSVASVTVTYNAAQVLVRHIEALQRQTRLLQEIIVVDNASTDGTCMLLAERYPQVTVLRMSENLGMAGAWAGGLRYAALEKRHEWVWTFDDDSVPKNDALEALLKGIQSLADANDEVGIVASIAIHRDTGTCYPPFLWREGPVRPPAELLRQPIVFADLVMASGCMVRRDVVERIGLPRADFFMDFFDTEYCLRARSHGYRIAVITGSELDHEIGNARWVRLPGYSRLRAEHTPWRQYYRARNVTYAVWWLYPSRKGKRYVVRHLARRAVGLLLFDSNKLACLKKMAQGFWDGRRGRLGMRFGPVECAAPRFETVQGV